MPFIEKDFPIEEINKLAIREANARKPIYLVHKWWARRPGPTFRAIILATFLDEDPMKLFYQKVNLEEELGYSPIILDPFMGGGTTVIEAVRLGAKVVGVDINPVAWFITKKEIEPVMPKKFEEISGLIETEMAKRIGQYYKTTCPHEKNHEADIMYAFWVRLIKCENCRKEVPLFKNFVITKSSHDATVFCPKCRFVFNIDIKNEKAQCPECRLNFTPQNGIVEDRIYKCPHCGFSGEVSKALKKFGKPGTEFFALEYYCRACDEKGFKRAEFSDIKLFERAKNEYDNQKHRLLDRLIPSQTIPWDTMQIRRVQNSVYEHFYDLFNERQLLCFATLLERIMQISDENLREYFLMTLSDCTNANNMMCKYNLQAKKLEPLFGHHTIWAPQMPVENNVLGTKYGRGTFKKYIAKALRALEYARKPYEVHMSTNGKTKKIYINGEYVKARIAENFTELKNGDSAALLLSTTSENLKDHIPNESVDAIVTDPAYYDNIMYSEVSNFFYVWLRLGLKEEHPQQFSRPLMDARREIVVSPKIGKGPEFYVDAMRRCFTEAHRVLKKGGFLAMTFHHSSPEAWAAVVKFLVESGFTIRGAYPIHSETRSGVHPGIEYDSIIVCRRVEESQLLLKPLPKAIFEAEVRNRVDADADRFVEEHPRLSIEDLYVAVMGRALQVLSENYAVMLRSGKALSTEDVRKTLEDLGDIAFDVLVKKFFAKIPDVDRVSKTYASIFAGKKYVSLDTIDKVTKYGGINLEVFEKELLIGERKKSTRKVLDPSERRNLIVRKLDRGYALSYIDAAQMLRLAWIKGKFKQAAGQYAKNGVEKNKLESYIKFLAQRTGDKEWARIAKALEETSIATLEKWI